MDPVYAGRNTMTNSFSPPAVVDTHVADTGHVKIGIIGTMRALNNKFTR
jgi:hypothetical protein